MQIKEREIENYKNGTVGNVILWNFSYMVMVRIQIYRSTVSHLGVPHR